MTRSPLLSWPLAQALAAALWAAGSPASVDAAPDPAVSGGSLSLRAASMHAGGGHASGGPWRATVAIGQPEYIPGLVAGGGAFELTAGVLRRVVPVTDALFADGFESLFTSKGASHETR
jgi:hypothetical protein